MINRRVSRASSANVAILPLHHGSVVRTDPFESYDNDDGGGGTGKHQQQQHHHNPPPRTRFRPSPNQLQNLYKSLMITFTVAIFFVFVARDLPMSDDENLEETVHHHTAPRKGQFPSLEYPLQHSTLVGIYFAAAWCPMSTPVTTMLDELFRDVLLKPPPIDSTENDVSADTFSLDQHYSHRKGFSIIYVSSDSDSNEMHSYVKPNWFSVPFNNVEERSNIKRFYLTCAKRELTELGFERKREIPSLIILSGESRDVLTYNGIQDLKDHGVQAVDHWLEINRLNLALLDKYGEHH
jgi:Thioredoxin-like